jgi:hypothetical protein
MGVFSQRLSNSNAGLGANLDSVPMSPASYQFQPAETIAGRALCKNLRNNVSMRQIRWAVNLNEMTGDILP